MTEYNIILYDRLLFELKILYENLENIINSHSQSIQITKTHIEKIQNNFYAIINNLST
jgi:hypothetical protein